MLRTFVYINAGNCGAPEKPVNNEIFAIFSLVGWRVGQCSGIRSKDIYIGAVHTRCKRLPPRRVRATSLSIKFKNLARLAVKVVFES